MLFFTVFVALFSIHLVHLLDAKGLLAGVSRLTVQFVHPLSCLADSAPGTVELHSSPMVYMVLLCVKEMS